MIDCNGTFFDSSRCNTYYRYHYHKHANGHVPIRLIYQKKINYYYVDFLFRFFTIFIIVKLFCYTIERISANVVMVEFSNFLNDTWLDNQLRGIKYIVKAYAN